ncbi:MAG: L-glutamate gamma-semialdehyde dehydrogenase, partial [Pseudomonadota bacterium]
GANSSFVNQIVDKDVPVEEVAADPFEALAHSVSVVTQPGDLYAPERTNSQGLDLHDPVDLTRFDEMRAPFATTTWRAVPLIVGEVLGGDVDHVLNPAQPTDKVGEVVLAAPRDVEAALDAAQPWEARAEIRAAVLAKAADLYEAHAGELYALLAREAGKTPMDAIAELREAVDFLRYYAVRGQGLETGARGIFTCISPWNFPLAIFTGQIAAALAAGNGVLAKPAEPTQLVAHRAVQLLHEAGVPGAALQLLPGAGAVVGAAVTAHPKIKGVCFTGSTRTAQTIHKTMAEALAPTAPLIAETGGLNAMIVDSTALPEQAIKDIIASAFQSAGQRCSALRVLYVQEDIAETFKTMLFGAMDELTLGNPWDLSTDMGPIITQEAGQNLLDHIEVARREGRLVHQGHAPQEGCFVPPTVLRVGGIGDLAEEVFGPILHLATYSADQLDQVIETINGSGYGLTFGLHTRIDDRVELISDRIQAGNIYVNRNQIGAIVGSQPFGGEGLSGTGPKAGGPTYVKRFAKAARQVFEPTPGVVIPGNRIQAALGEALVPGAVLHSLSLPGPTGESNRLSHVGRGVVLCLGPGAEAARAQARAVRSVGCAAVAVAPGLSAQDGIDGVLAMGDLSTLSPLDAVVSFAPDEPLRAARQALVARPGAIVPLLAEADFATWCQLERHVCVDTTAAGGNAALLAKAS